MSIKTQHNEHEVAYDEREDVWVCTALKLRSATLTALKAKINAVEAQERKLGDGGVAVINFGYSSLRDASKARATTLDNDGHGVWIVKQDKTRAKVAPHSLTADVPAAWEVLESARKLDKQGRDLCAAALKLIDELPRYTREKLLEAKLEQKVE